MDRVYLKFASVEDGSVYLEWEDAFTDLDHEYIIYRSKDNFVFNQIYLADSNTLSYTDTNVNTSKNAYYYRIKLHELNCKYLSRESNLAKTILFNVHANLGDRNIMELNWDNYEKWKNGVLEYKIEYYDDDVEDFVEIESLKNKFNYIYDVRDIPKLEHCFRITAVEEGNSNSFSHSNTDCDLGPSKLYIPNAFTPNNDTRNEKFGISCSGCELESFIIFDRWGQIIFESFEPDAKWDGSINGLDAPAGVYYYQLVILSHDNPALKRSGTLTLIR
jgi:gliding motility-associated-like protein